MITIKFIVDKYVLLSNLAHRYRGRGKYFEDFSDFFRMLKRFDGWIFQFITLGMTNMGGYTDDIINGKFGLPDRLKKFYDKAFTDKKFIDFYKETIEYRDNFVTEWNDKKDEISKHLRDIVKTKIDSRDLTVYIVHPRINTGLCLGDGMIYWGHSSQKFKHYGLIYIIHEVFHTILTTKSNITHSIIEFIADNELRMRLNKTNNGYNIGHDHLHGHRKVMLPYWKKYINQDKENIFEFDQRMLKLIRIEK